MSTPSSDLMSANAGKSTTDSTIRGSAGADPQTPHDQVFRLIMAAWGSQAVRTLASLSVAERQYSPTPLKHYAQAAIGPAFWPPALLLPEAVRQGSGQAVAAIGSDVFTYFSAHSCPSSQPCSPPELRQTHVTGLQHPYHLIEAVAD